jgi:serine/threonine-protein kinase
VFLAKAAGPKGFEKTLVLKRILPHLAEDQHFVEMFLSEAKIAAQFNHPNIVQIYDFGEAEGVYYLAMEYIDGPNLRSILRRTLQSRALLPIPLCVKMVSLACEGLAYAHEFADPQSGAPLGLIHCDISPENVLLSRNGSVKVVDFGIAKAAGFGPQNKAGTFKGKVSYMPPERIQGNPFDLRADIFSLGVVLYELVTGVKPFNARTDVSILHAILQEPIVPISARSGQGSRQPVSKLSRVSARPGPISGEHWQGGELSPPGALGDLRQRCHQPADLRSVRAFG